MGRLLFGLLPVILALRVGGARLLLQPGRDVGSSATGGVEDASLGAIPGRYIVMFKPGQGSTEEVASMLQQELSQTMTTASVSAAPTSSRNSSDAAFTVVSSLIANHGSDSSSGDVTVRAAGSSSNNDSGSSRGIQGMLIQASEGAAQRIKQSNLVTAVFADRVVESQVNTCVESRYLSSGTLSGTPSSSLKWPDCYNGDTRLVWLGRRCGSDSAQIEYTAMYVINRATGRVKTVNGQQCILSADPSRAVWHRQRFGACGRAPVYAPDLPTSVCSATGGEVAACIPAATSPGSAAAPEPSRITLTRPTMCGGKWALRLTYSGVTCGPGNTLVQWTSAVTQDGCVLRPNPNQVKWTAELFGSCGTPPGNATAEASSVLCPNPNQTPVPPDPVQSPSPDPSPSPSPSPQPDNPATLESSPPPASPNPSAPDPATQPESLLILPRVPLLSGEQLPAGVSCIGGPTSVGVVNTAGLPTSLQVTVGVIDSGVDGTHPEINLVDGRSWVARDAAANDTAASEGDALTDGYGHGTHVAGIIGAMNNGAGVVGVSPGSPIYSLKVLDSNGKGSMSSVLSAVNWVLLEGLSKGIRILNLSLAAYVDPSAADYADAFAAVCSVFQQASDAGVLLTVSAGNYASSVQGYLPAACPSVAAVTALNADGNGVASYSNWLPDSSGSDAKAQVIAAPGTNILSTISYARDLSGYKVLSGTSMAAPHVAGVAANCVMSGVCGAGATGQQMLASMQSLAQKRLEFGKYGFVGDATSTINGKYAGYLVWSGF